MATADAIDLTTLAKVKTELGPSVTNLTGAALAQVEDLLQGIITACSRVLMTQIGRRIKSSTITKTFHGDATYGMALPNGPVTAVSAVSIDENSIPQSTSVTEPGWILLNDRLELRGYVFTAGTGNVMVTYTSGFGTVPQDIERACVELSVWVYQNRNHVGIQQRSVHDADAVTFRKDEWPFLVQMTVDAYKTSLGIAIFGGVEE